MMATRRLAIGGVIGPVSFIGAWVVGALTTSVDYSMIDDAISRLAAVGADSRALMTTGFVTFGVALPVFGSAMRRHVAGSGWIAAVTTGIATLAVAATPLDRSSTVDTLHGVFATVGYISLIAVPLLSFGPLRTDGHDRLALAGALAATVSTASLVLSSTGLPTGFFQRLGLTATDLWIITLAISIATGRVTQSHRGQASF